MAITYKGVHHRSPSGMHNKVRWILSECKWDFDKFSTLEKEMRTNGEKYTNHLTEAFDIARYILYCGDIRTLPSIFFEKYHWIEQECMNYAKRRSIEKMKESNNCLTCGCKINHGCLYCIDCIEEVIEKSLQGYMENPKWNGKLFMQDEKTCYKDGFRDGVNSSLLQIKFLKKENKKLQKLLLQQQQLVRGLKCCGNCDRNESRGRCGYEDRCYSYIYIHQYLRPFFCEPVDLKEIEGYKDYWKPILTRYKKLGDRKK